MAGKVHALLTRTYPKGRDWYDLVWYRAIRPPIEPNLELLQNALDQTQGAGSYHAENWKATLMGKVRALNCAVLVEDVRNFLERPQDSELLTEDNICSVLA